jgi:hypothetical protein
VLDGRRKAMRDSEKLVGDAARALFTKWKE